MVEECRVFITLEHTNNKMDYSFDFKNKVAIITGSSKGIGKSIAMALASCGAAVVVSSRSQEAVDEVANEINESGGIAIGIACHVGKEEQLDQLVEKTKEHFGGIDILINNAATNPVFAQLLDSDPDVFDKIMNINVKACMLLANKCYESMVERGGGSVINIASVEGLKPSFGLSMYSMSKAALIMLTKTQAVEWSSKGIRANAICPGLIQTKFSEALWKNEQVLEKFVKHLPMKRMAQPEEMVGLALHLASDQSSYTTGGVYESDGGYMLM
jgi:NAD(P)-dependent dehydrogenase (short-subunit alcohol dehydrogenase family)